MKKSFALLIASCFTFFAFTSVETGSIGESPGIIQAVGNAGSDQIFTFQKWNYVKVEMPEDKIENIQLEIEINTSSATCEWKELEKNVKKKKDYFYIKKFPKAMVSINGATATGDGNYKTNALLTLKGKSNPVALTFSISDTKPRKVKGEGIVMRRKFGFTGNGPNEQVPISFEIVLPE